MFISMFYGTAFNFLCISKILYYMNIYHELVVLKVHI